MEIRVIEPWFPIFESNELQSVDGENDVSLSAKSVVFDIDPQAEDKTKKPDAGEALTVLLYFQTAV